MVTIDISIEDISKLLGHSKPLDIESLDQEMMLAIAEVDSDPEGPDENGHTKVSIDIKTSNRPDLWSAEGIARIVNGKHSPGLPDLDADPSGYEIIVDPSLKEVRPYIGAAIVRGLVLDDFLIKQMIQIQDKVDFSYGRRRKRTSIGIYNINMVESPIQYTTVDREFKFIPLQFEDELTVDEIFEQHPKGIEYRSILDRFDNVPMLIGNNDVVLSMPPIINSNVVGRVTEETTDVLVETTGTDRDAALVSLAVVVQALRDRGGIVESVEIRYPDNYPESDEITPETKLVEIEVDVDTINKYLGTEITPKKMLELLRKRRNDGKVSGRKITVQAAPWRKDILHWVDISEEVAIAADYNALEPTTAKVVTAGKLDRSTDDENMVRQLLVGLQLIEVRNYTLTNPEILTDKLEKDHDMIKQRVIRLSNPVTSTFSIVRNELTPVLLQFTSRNTHVEYPQRIFETGEIVEIINGQPITKSHAAVLLAGANETFETIHSVLASMFNLLRIEYTLEPSDDPLYIVGRRAKIQIAGEVVGILGELHPRILTNFGIDVPISTFEIDLSKLPSIKISEISTNGLRDAI